MAAINFWAERKCILVIKNMHEDARKKGYNLSAPNYQPVWWFKWASKIEGWTRRSVKKK